MLTADLMLAKANLSDPTDRLQLSDVLDDAGRYKEAERLRDLDRRVVLDEGCVWYPEFLCEMMFLRADRVFGLERKRIRDCKNIRTGDARRQRYLDVHHMGQVATGLVRSGEWQLARTEAARILRWFEDRRQGHTKAYAVWEDFWRTVREMTPKETKP
jgi:hypothetical protein